MAYSRSTYGNLAAHIDRAATNGDPSSADRHSAAYWDAYPYTAADAHGDSVSNSHRLAGADRDQLAFSNGDTMAHFHVEAAAGRHTHEYTGTHHTCACHFNSHAHLNTIDDGILHADSNIDANTDPHAITPTHEYGHRYGHGHLNPYVDQHTGGMFGLYTARRA